MYIYIYIGYSSGGETLPTVHSKMVALVAIESVYTKKCSMVLHFIGELLADC